MRRTRISTVKEVKSLLNKGELGQHALGNGLYLKVNGINLGSWVFRYQLNFKRHRLGLGSCDIFTLAEARNLAHEHQKSIALGINPIEHRVAKRVQKIIQDVLFRTLAEEYIEIHKHGWKNKKHAQQWTNTLTTYAFPIIGDLYPKDIETAHILEILTPIWFEKNETANRVRNRIESVLDYAKVKNLREGDNPAQWKGNIEYLLPKNVEKTKKHHPALPWKYIQKFWSDLCKDDSLSSYALQLTILTATRTSDVIEATWQEFDLENKLWIIPAIRMKTPEEHRIPLSDTAVEVLKKIPKTTNPYVFFGQKDNSPLSNMAMAMKCRRMHDEKLKLDGKGWINHLQEVITVHGFRSTFRDWAAEKTDHSNIVAEKALAHTIKSDVEAAYRRGDLLEKRTQLMDDWAQFITKK